MGKDNQSSGVAHNALATETIIKGNISATEDIRVDGTVEGNIECTGKVVIGPKGLVTGDILCENAELLGKVVGNMKISDNLTLRSTAFFEGEINTKTLVIEPNAVFHGKCSMKN